MRRLLVVSDLYLAPAEHSGGHARLPQLPALCELLRLGKVRERQVDWRAGLATDLGARELANCATGSVAACAVGGLVPGNGVCLADPVHMIAGMASVHLHPAGLVSLDSLATAELQQGFASEFGSSSQRLHVAGNGLLLESPVASAACGADPARLLGNAMEIPRGQGEAHRQLRRLGVEVEMWLSGSKLNRDREKRGQLPVTALWFWGGGSRLPETPAPGSTTWNEAYGADPWLHGFWQRIAGRAVHSAETWDAIAEGSAVIAVSAVRPPRPEDEGSLVRLESDWFAPALRDLRAGRISEFTLRLGGRSWELGTRPRWRWWSRTRPWWQVLAA